MSVRFGGLMVSSLVSGSSCPGSSQAGQHCVVFVGKTLYSYSAVSTHVYKRAPANLMLGNSATDQHPIHTGRSRNTPSHFMLQKTWQTAG